MFGKLQLRVLGAVTVLILAGCGGGTVSETPPDEALREQIHAATGHEPQSCVDYRSRDALILITDQSITECVIVNPSSNLTIRNQGTSPATFVASDPGGNMVVRHVRIEADLGPGDEYVISPTSELVGDGVYPYWVRGSQPEGKTGSLVVRS